MAKGKRTASFYKEAVKILRHGYLDPETGKRGGRLASGFDADAGYDLRQFNEWTPAQKAKVTRYFNEVDKLTARPYYVYRPRKKKNLAIAQKAAQHEKKLKNLEVAFIPVADAKTKPTIKITRRGVKVKQRGISRFLIPLKHEKLATDPIETVNEAIQDHPAKMFKIQAGMYETKFAKDKHLIADEVAKHVAKYSDTEANNFHGNWLFGLVGYDFDKHKDFSAYMQAKERSAAKLKERRVKARRKAKYQARKNR